jgi:hypothetical protein
VIVMRYAFHLVLVHETMVATVLIHFHRSLLSNRDVKWTWSEGCTMSGRCPLWANSGHVATSSRHQFRCHEQAIVSCLP